MKRIEPLTLPVDGGAVEITLQQWSDYVSAELSDQRGEMETVGPWHLPIRYSAPAITVQWAPTPYAQMATVTFHGKRTMHGPKESGYHLEGRVSLKGNKVSAFTSSQMFRLPDGTLLESKVIHCRENK